jgi:uncharacterized protein
MTFNEGMQIDTSTTSSSGGGLGRRAAIGGGLGGLLIVVVAVFLGVDPANLLGGDQQAGPQQASPGFDLSQCKTGADAAQRQQWFTAGYQTGDPKQCDTYDAADLG